MASIALGFLLLVFASCAFAQNYQWEALKLHNHYRAKHRSPPLKLDSQLNKNAVRCARWLAAKGKLIHECPYRYGAADNLAYSMSSKQTETSAARDATYRWYREVKYYDYNRPGFSLKTGHFTQLVWKSSTKLGIGVHLDKASGKAYVVALYTPHGNMKGEFPKNVLRS